MAMQSRRDQVQAHSYLVGRLTSALVSAEPDAPEPPLRRTTIGWFASLVIGLILVAIFAVFGLIFPGNDDSWRAEGVLIVEEESGNRYLFVDGRLHPVRNYASARLLIGREPTVESVSRRSLAGVPHGHPVGIPHAPDVLPDPSLVNQGDWLICTHAVPDSTGTIRPVVTVHMGSAADSAGLRPLNDDETVLIQGPDGDTYLAWRDRRLRLGAPWVADGLGMGSTAPVPVDPRWLNALPAGTDLAAPQVTELGREGPVVDGTETRVGQVLVVRNATGREEFYLVVRDGVTPLTPLEAALVLADPATAAAYPDGIAEPVPASPAAVSQLRQGTSSAGDELALPTAPPTPMTPGSDTAVCARHRPGPEGAEVRVTLVPDRDVLPRPRPVTTGDGWVVDDRVADAVSIDPNAGALVFPEVAPGVAGSAAYLITDTGVKYPVPSANAVEALGYAGVTPALIPPTVLALLPTGPALDIGEGR